MRLIFKSVKQSVLSYSNLINVSNLSYEYIIVLNIKKKYYIYNNLIQLDSSIILCEKYLQFKKNTEQDFGIKLNNENGDLCTI